jgi:Uma2 family endonuclease
MNRWGNGSRQPAREVIMASAAVNAPEIKNLADLVHRLGDVPLDRIRFHPPPGTATVVDVQRLQEQEGITCELIEGVLLEKAMGYGESSLASLILELVNSFVRTHNLGLVAGADGTLQIMPDLVRVPDVSFTSWDRLPGRRRPTAPVPQIVPNLAIEILSRSNTAAEMAAKRRDYFAAGVQLVWEFEPDTRTVAVYSSVSQMQTLKSSDTLDGGAVLPGFKLALAAVFAELDRKG